MCTYSTTNSSWDESIRILQLVGAGIMSRRTAIEKLSIVNDPDAEWLRILSERGIFTPKDSE